MPADARPRPVRVLEVRTPVFGGGVAGVVDGDQVQAGEAAGATAAVDGQAGVDVVEQAAAVGPGGSGEPDGGQGPDGDEVVALAEQHLVDDRDPAHGHPVAAPERADLDAVDAGVVDGALVGGAARQHPAHLAAAARDVDDEVVAQARAPDLEAVGAGGVGDVHPGADGVAQLDAHDVVAAERGERRVAGPGGGGSGDAGDEDDTVGVADEEAVRAGAAFDLRGLEDAREVLDGAGGEVDAVVRGGADDEEAVVEAEVASRTTRRGCRGRWRRRRCRGPRHR